MIMELYPISSGEAETAGPYRPIDDPDALRATGSYPVLTPQQLIDQIQNAELRAATQACGAIVRDTDLAHSQTCDQSTDIGIMITQ